MTTVLTLGGQLAAEGAAILRNAGVGLLETDVYPAKALVIDLLEKHRPQALIVRLIDMVDADIIAASPQLRLIAKHGAGTNDIDVPPCGDLGSLRGRRRTNPI